MIRTLEKSAVILLQSIVLSLLSLGVHAADRASLNGLELLKLLHKRQYEELENALSSVQARYESGQTSDNDVIRAFKPFANSDPAHEELLNEWVQMMPDSYVPLAVRGLYYVDVGWSVRGSDFAQYTSNEQFAGMRKFHSLGLADLQSALEINPRFIVGYAEIISLSKATGRKRLLERTLEEALEVDPRSYAVRSSYLLGLMPRWGGSYEEIERFIDDTRIYTDENPNLKQLLGFADYVRAFNYKERGDYQTAIDYYTKALEHGDSPRYYKDRGIAYDYLEQYDKALRDLTKAIELSSHYADALAWRGTIYKDLKMYDKALVDLTLAARLKPYDFLVLKHLGNVHFNTGKYQEAEKAYSDALHYEKNHGDIWRRKAWILAYKLHRPKEATEAFKIAARQRPYLADYWYSYGEFLHRQNDCELVPVFRTYMRACASSSDQTCRVKDIERVERIIDQALTERSCPDKGPYPIKREALRVAKKGGDHNLNPWTIYKTYVRGIIQLVLESLRLPLPE